MLKVTQLAVLLGAFGIATVAAPRVASASLASCGNIKVEAEAECVAKTGVECEAQCTPVSVKAACAGKLQVECGNARCEVPTIDCTLPTSCQADCQGACEVEPAEFSCEGSCDTRCSANCEGQCSAEANKAECEASCEATCSSECTGSCDGHKGSVDCEGSCDASCNGSCRAEGTMRCQIDCQSEGYLDCESELSGGCTAACKTEDGALFCDGQYVDHGDNLAECVSALEAVITSSVDLSASGSASCEGNTCKAEGKASCECGVPGRRASGGLAGPALVFALGLAGVGLRTRTRRRRG